MLQRFNGRSKLLERLPILIVEDEPVLRLEALDIVEAAGFEPVEATSVEHAIRILEERTDIRLVYMDRDMRRGIKGIEVAAAIRNRWPPIEIILIAAFSTGAELELPVRAQFYPQPVRHNQIIGAMQTMMRNVQQGGAAHC
ncbi:CheY-like chemotaxis protein [Novosphingobium chloroacetimidivorans]|uniref:CheY-like chemotaxis protein n=1 Tax=Novosphingobium chloroacetimidivorans TaxID=1428314 RepID=A0A7W7NXT5_9SPHN|nr:response regulator [Novosphingobium chloroacetimidivorans]MBB4860706.1 CheY-like chemotaxis protein [Novosphingobium chloroacetimidivorans]